MLNKCDTFTCQDPVGGEGVEETPDRPVTSFAAYFDGKIDRRRSGRHTASVIRRPPPPTFCISTGMEIKRLPDGDKAKSSFPFAGW